MALPAFAYFDGKIIPYQEARIGVMAHALNYGTAAFGGIRGYWNQEEEQLFVFRPYDHFRRFLQSAKLLRMEITTTEEELIAGMVELIRMEAIHTDCYVRPLVFYGDEIIGVRLHNLTAHISMVAVPFGRYVENEENAHATVSSWRRVDDNVIPARGKIAGAYVNSAFAKSDAQLAGFDEAIVLNQDGHVSEGSAENIFVVRNGVVATPAITDNILEGITRRTVTALLREELHTEVEHRAIDRTELFLADEVFFTGTGVQISAVTRIDHRPIGTGKMGPITAGLRELYFNVVRGRVVKYRPLCSPVYVGHKKGHAVQGE